MGNGTKEIKQKVMEVITESFDSNPSVNSVIKNDGKRKQRIKALSDYSFETSLMRDGVYVSCDGEGVALCYKYNLKKESFRDYLNQVKLVVRAISLSRVLSVMKREAYVKSLRPASGEFLYFWFLGVSNKARGTNAAWELKEMIFNDADNNKLPIYLETSVEKNKRVYQRFGFEVYHIWESKDLRTTLWFMRRMPMSN